MKHKNSKKSRPTNSKIFTLDSVSAALDFAKFAPERVKSVECPEKYIQCFAQCGVQAEARDSGIRVDVHIEARNDVDLLDAVIRDEPSVLVALDHVTDPRNLGAVVRSAGFFGVPYVIAPKDRQVGLTPAAVSTAQGGFAVTDFVAVTNLARTLQKLKDLGYWVLGADVDGTTMAEAVAVGYKKVVIVLGSEDKGLSGSVRKNCDLAVCIPSAKEGIQSLNVSVAAGILMQGWAKKK
ncbi:MAG: 23S rRNA (guanosine(2251)-2'-O)-methyltransferase RlmB [Oligoflexales bacterium]